MNNFIKNGGLREMTSKEILTFQDALDTARYFNKKYSEYSGMNVLLANGFSIACCKDIFSYKTLFDYSDFSENISNVFKTFGTFDFEKIIKKLNDTSKIVNIYDHGNNIIQQLEVDANKIKDELVNVISKKHPEHQHKIPDYKFCSAYRFLSNFNEIYTLNYDMLLYWTLMLEIRNSDLLNYLKINLREYKDNFGRSRDGELCWYRKNSSQKIFYLHGALHLFDDGYDVIKVETTPEENLMDVIRNRLDNNQYPLIVAEGSSEEKMNKISHNKYLQNTLENLGYIKGNLFVHGHSLDDNDKHILDTISSAWNLKQIFISVYNPEKNFEEIQNKAYAHFVDGQRNPKSIFFYDAESANVWNSINKEDIDKFEIDEFFKNSKEEK